MLLGKLDNASRNQMGYMVVHVSDLVPQVCIVLYTLSYDASLRPFACNTPEIFLPKAIYPLSTTNELSGKSRTFNTATVKTARIADGLKPYSFKIFPLLIFVDGYHML